MLCLNFGLPLLSAHNLYGYICTTNNLHIFLLSRTLLCVSVLDLTFPLCPPPSLILNNLGSRFHCPHFYFVPPHTLLAAVSHSLYITLAQLMYMQQLTPDDATCHHAHTTTHRMHLSLAALSTPLTQIRYNTKIQNMVTAVQHKQLQIVIRQLHAVPAPDTLCWNIIKHVTRYINN